MTRAFPIAGGLLSLVLAEATPVFGQTCSPYSGPVYRYYYPPIYYYPPAYCYQVMPVPAPTYAKPSIAPPSGAVTAPQVKEPPLGKPPAQKEPPWDTRPVPKEPAKPPSGKPPLGDPLDKPPVEKPPSIIESRSQGGNYVPAKERCRVGFWNLTGRDVVLKINGQTHQLAKDRALTVEVERAFIWQVDQQEPNRERVAESQASHEVILRK